MSACPRCSLNVGIALATVARVQALHGQYVSRRSPDLLQPIRIDTDNAATDILVPRFGHGELEHSIGRAWLGLLGHHTVLQWPVVPALSRA